MIHFLLIEKLPNFSSLTLLICSLNAKTKLHNCINLTSNPCNYKDIRTLKKKKNPFISHSKKTLIVNALRCPCSPRMLSLIAPSGKVCKHNGWGASSDIKRRARSSVPITSNTAQQNKRKKLADKERVEEGVSDEARINIGAAFQRWREIRELKGFKTDAEFATFLLDR